MDEITAYKLGVELLATDFCNSSKFALNFDIMWLILNNLTFAEISEIIVNTNFPQKWDIYNVYLDTVDISHLIDQDEIEYYDDDYYRWMEYQYGEDLPVEWEEDANDVLYVNIN